MKTVRAYKAQQTRDEGVESLTLVLEETIPDSGASTVVEAYRLYTDQGAAIADALFDTLPGGTQDALLAAMLTRRASLFRVAFGAPRRLPVNTALLVVRLAAELREDPHTVQAVLDALTRRGLLPGGET